jgi:hypothetical protein
VRTVAGGQSGSLGLGGNGGGDTGGGGSGGYYYYGGGGGGSVILINSGFYLVPGGGGGGGSNLVPEGGTAILDDSGAPSIVISYQAGVGEPPPNKQACKKGGYKEFCFNNQGQCIKAVNEAS